MRESIFIEYENYINKLKSDIISLQSRFNVCRSILNYDYSNSEIYEDEYKRIIRMGIAQYSSDIDSRYELAKDQVQFLRDFAEIDSNGMIASSIVKDEYVKKRELLKKVFESIKVHNYFSSLDEETRKEELVRLVEDYFDKCEKISGADIKNLNERKNLLIKRVYRAEGDYLTYLIDLFFGTDIYYYKWYYSQELLSELDSGFVYDEHQNNCNDLNDNVVIYEDAIRDQSSLIEQKNLLTRNLSGFSRSIVDLDFSEFTKKGLFNGISLLLFRKRDNKDVLFSLFGEFSRIDGSLLFYRKLSEPNSIIKIASCFEKYFAETYGHDINYVDVETFIRNIIGDIIECYQNEIAKIDELLLQKQTDISRKSENLLQKSLKVKREAKTQRDIFMLQMSGEQYKIHGLSLEEERRVFEDMREYLVVNTNKVLEITNEFESPILKKER